MIFIKDKKAWKEFVKENDKCSIWGHNKEYPFYLELKGRAVDDGDLYETVHKQELQSMLEKLDSGREF